MGRLDIPFSWCCEILDLGWGSDGLCAQSTAMPVCEAARHGFGPQTVAQMPAVYIRFRLRLSTKSRMHEGKA